MTTRHLAKSTIRLLDLLDRRFGLRLDIASSGHLRNICEHYLAKRRMLLWEHGEAAALRRSDYAKAVLISEVVRLLLREIDPWPRRRKQKGNKSYG